MDDNKKSIPPDLFHPFLLEQEGSIGHLDFRIETASYVNIMITNFK